MPAHKTVQPNPTATVRSVQLSWGSSLLDKPSVTIHGQALGAGFVAYWRQGTGRLTIQASFGRLPPGVSVAATWQLIGPAPRVWQEARRFTDHVLDRGFIPGTRLRLGALILEADGRIGSAPIRNMVAGGLFAQARGIAGSFEVDRAGAVRFGYLTPPAPQGPFDPARTAAWQKLSTLGQGMHTPDEARTILTNFIGRAQAQAVVEAMVAAGPLFLAFARTVAVLLPMAASAG